MDRAVFPPCCLTWGQSIVEVMKVMATSFKRSHTHTTALVSLTLRQATADPHLYWTLTGKSGSVSCGVTAPFSWLLVHTRLSLCPPRVCFPVLCKFWWLYGGVNGDLFQESLCHIQVYCTKSPCPYGRPLLTHTFARDSQTQFWLSLCGVSGCLCPQGLFEPSEHLWWVRRLILKVISYFKNVNFLISSMISGKFHEVIGHV